MTCAFRVFNQLHEGGAWRKRGRKPVAELRPSFGTSILALGVGGPAGSVGPWPLPGPGGALREVLLPLRSAGRLAAYAAEARHCRWRCSWSASELTMRA